MSVRIGVVFPLRLESGHLGKDVCLIPEGLARLGFDVSLYCPEARGHAWPFRVLACGAGSLRDADHWRAQGLDAAIVFSFMRHGRIVAAIAAAGSPVIAKGDTTGHVIARAHVRASLAEAWNAPETTAGRALALASWLARCGPLRGREARELLGVVGTAAATVVETRPAAAAVAHALRREGAADLVDRLAIIGNPIAADFLEGSVPPARERLVVAVGRWDLKIKDAPLLRAALGRFLDTHPEHRAVVVGRGQGDRFAGHPRLSSAAPMPQAELAGLLRRARIVVSSSHSESFSLSSHEGLALGCSVVGPRLHPLRDAVDAGPYGTLAGRRTPRSLAAALAAEAATWERGARDPVAGAAFWRRRLDGDLVARRFADLLALVP